MRLDTSSTTTWSTTWCFCWRAWACSAPHLAPYQAELDDAFGLSQRRDLAVLPVVGSLGAYVFLVFGFLSAAATQADIYGCRAVSCSQHGCDGHLPEALAEGGRGCVPAAFRFSSRRWRKWLSSTASAATSRASSNRGSIDHRPPRRLPPEAADRSAGGAPLPVACLPGEVRLLALLATVLLVQIV